MNYEIIPSVAERLQVRYSNPMYVQQCPQQYVVPQQYVPPQQCNSNQQYVVPQQYVPQQYVPPQQCIPNQQYIVPQQQVFDRAMVTMTGTNPIRGMYTSVYTDICSQYGSSSVQVNPSEYYSGSKWCQIGIVTNHNIVNGLESRFIGNSWEFRVKDPITGLNIYLSTIGNGPYGAYRDNDSIHIPGKEGIWKIQIQTQHNPYILYMPV